MALEEATSQDGDPGETGGLGAMRMLMSGQPLAGQDQLEAFANQPVVDPSNKWLHMAAGALAPNPSRSFSGAASNALGAMAGAQDTEAALRAKYAPVIAAALLQRQQMQFRMAESQHKLATEYHGNLVSALAPLTTGDKPAISDDDLIQHIGPLVRSQIVPGSFASQFVNSLPKDPIARAAYIRHASLSAQKAEGLVGSITPKIELPNTGGGITPTNVNTQAGPVGPVGGTIPTTLKPEDYLPTTIETKNGPFIFSKLTGKSAPAGSPEGQAIAAEARGTAPRAPAQGPGPGAPMPSRPAPAAPGAPSVTATTDPAAQAAETHLGEAYAKYEGGLNTEASQVGNLVQRLNEMTEAAKQFRPGATGEARAKFGGILKDLMLAAGVPPAQAAAAGDKVVGGSLASMIEFKKLAVSGAMDALKTAAGTGQRFTQAEYAQFLKANPNIELDPDALEKINNFAMNQYRKITAEQQFAAQSRQGGMKVQDIPAAWTRKAVELGYIKPQVTQGVTQGSALKPTTTPIGTDLDGRKIRQVNGQWEYE